MAKLKKHLQHPLHAPPTPEWDLTAAACGSICASGQLVAHREDATCKRCLKNTCEVLP